MSELNQPDNNSISPSPVSSGDALTYNNWSGYGSETDKLRQKLMGIKDVPTGGSTEYISPNLINISGRYPIQNIGYNNEDLYAQGQSFFSKLGNSSLKMAGIAATTFTEGTLGLLTGVYSAASNGKLSSFYNNEFSQGLQEWNNQLENKYPNYYTEAEKSADWKSFSGVLQNLTSGNFWTDGILKNLGFIAGMWGSSLAYSSALKALRGTSKLTAAGRVEDALAVTDDIVRSKDYSLLNSRISDAANKASSLLTSDKGQRVIISGLSTIGEAKIEALHTATDFKKSLIDKYIQENGTEPFGEELQKIEDAANDAANSVYALNTALLTLSNYIVLPKLLGSSIKGEKSILNSAKINAIKRGESGVFEAVQPTNFAKRIQSVGRNVSSILSIREGLEEGLQFAASVGSESYYNKKYAGENVSVIDDLFGKGLSEMLSDEGIENFAIGAISGGLVEKAIDIKTGESKKERASQQEAVQNVLKELNNRPYLNFTQFTKDTIDSVNRHTILEAQKAAAIRQGDTLEAKELERDIAHNYLTPRIKNERFDLVMDDISSYRKLASTQEGFEQLKTQGIVSGEETLETFLNRLSNFERHAVLLNSVYQSLNQKYSAITNESGQLLYTPEVIDKLAYSQAKIADYDTRIPQLQSELLSKGVNSAAIIDNIKVNSVPSTQATQDAINYINNLDVVSDVKDELKTQLSDLIELSLRRNDFIKEYDDIKNNPERYQDTVTPEEESGNFPDGLQELATKIKSGATEFTPEELQLQANYPQELEELLNVAPEINSGRLYTKTPQQFKVRKKKNEDKFELVSPDKNVQATYNTREEAEAQREFENQKLEALSEVEVIRPTESGLYEVKTKAGTTEYLAPDFFKGYELVKTEEEKATEREDVNRDLKDVQGNLNNEGGTDFPTPPPTETTQLSESPTKRIDLLFVSGTQNQKRDEAKPIVRNLNTFLSNYSNFPDRNNLKVIIASPSNEGYLGIKGLASTLLGNVTGVEPPISYVAVEKTVNNLYFVDKEGNRIGEVTKGLYEGVDMAEVIANTLPDTDLRFKDGPDKGNYRFHVPNATPEETKEIGEAYQKAWEDKRKQILSETSSYSIFDFRVSRGIAERYPKDAQGNSPRNPVTILVPEEAIEDQGLVQVSVAEQGYAKDGEFYKFPLGSLVLDYGATLETLESRKLTPKEASTIFEILKEVAVYADSDKSLKNPVIQRTLKYVQGLLYTDSKEVKSRVWFNNGFYYIGSLKVPLSTKSFEDRRLEIINELQDLYITANNKKLKDNLSFEEITSFKNGEIKSKVWDSYQQFLLSPSGRSVEQIPFTTSIVNPPKFWNRYISVPGMLSVEAPQVKQPPQAPSQQLIEDAEVIEETPVQVVGRSIFEDDVPAGTTIKKAQVGSRTISYIGDAPNIQIIQDDAYLEVYASVLTNVKKPDGTPIDEDAAYIVTDDFLTKQIAPPITQAPKTSTVSEEQKIEKKIEDNPPAQATEVDPAEGDYREVVAHWDSVTGTIDKEEKWFKERFNIPFNRLKNLIRTTSGGFAWGMFKDNAVYIYENAEEGTTYHEAFEAVWAMFTDLKEKLSVLDEFRSREGSYIDRVSGRVIKYKDATEAEAKEQLAEEFRDFVLSGKLSKKPVKNKNFIYKLFSQLVNFIKSFFTGPKAQSNTEELFEKINAGYYKTASPVSEGLTEPEYRLIALPGLSFTDTYSIVQGVAAEVFQQLFYKEGPSALLNFDEPSVSVGQIYQEVYNILNNRYNTNKYNTSVLNLEDDNLKAQYQKIWEAISGNWGTVQEYVDEFLRTFGVKRSLQEDEHPFEDEESEVSAREDAYLRDPFTFDFQKEAPTSVKLLIGTLIESKFAEPNSPKTVSIFDGGTYMQKLANYSSIFNNLMFHMIGTNTMYQKKEVLAKLAQEDATYMRLYNKLGLRKDFSEFNLDEWKLWQRFVAVFSKQRPDAYIEYQGGGLNTLQAENINGSINEIVQGWLDSLKSGDNSLVTIEDGVYSFNGQSLADLPTKTPLQKSKFLAKLGIDFPKDLLSKLKGEALTEFDKAVTQLQTLVSKRLGITDISPRGLQIDGTLKKIAAQYFNLRGEGFESTYRGLNGQQTQQNVSLNTVGYIVNDINNAKTKDELLSNHREYQQPFAKPSVYLNSLLFDSKGKRKKLQLKMALVGGLVDRVTKRRTPNSKLTYAQRITETINANINKLYNVLVPADSKTEWLLEMDHLYSFDSFLNPDTWKKIEKTISAYFDAEKSIGGSKGLVYPMFADEKGNFSPEKMREFISSNNEAIKSALRAENKLTSSVSGKKEIFDFEGLDSDFVKNNNLETLTSEQLDQLLNFVSVNYMINNIELHILFFGDKNNIALKRYKSFLSPVERSIDSPELNNFLNREYNKGLKKGDPGYHEHKSYLSTATLEDVYTQTSEIVEDTTLPEATRAAYSENKISDAQGTITLPAYKEAQIKRNWGFTQGQERQLEYQMAYDRFLIDKDTRDGIVPEGFGWTYSSKELRERDQQIINKKNPNSGKFPVLKPLGAGQAFTKDGKRVTFLDKYSLAPAWYSMYREETKEGVKLKAGALQYLKMTKEGIDYTIYESGRKVGTQELNSMYTKEGDFNSSEYAGGLNVPWEYIGIQVETKGEKDSVTMGKQTTRLDKSNLLNNGVPVDVKLSLQQWSNLTEQEREDQSPVYKEVKLNERLISERLEAGYQELLDRFNIVDDGSRYTIEDFSKVEELLQDELFRREASSNKKDAIRLSPVTGEFEIPFEATTAYNEIKSILFSYVDKLIAKPKLNGGQRIQVSHSGFEYLGKRIKVKEIGKNKTPVFVSEGLKFYKAIYDKLGKRISVNRMEILLPNWFANKLRAQGINKTNEELLTYLNSTEEGKRILNGIGFRIPTQDLNSIEAFTVVGFLPEELGDAIVLPDAITTKAGSDFDIDKLNVYLKNVYVNSNGQIETFTRTQSKEETLSMYREEFDKLLEKRKEYLEKRIGSLNFEFTKVQEYLYELIGDKTIDKYENLFNRLFQDVNDPSDLEDTMMRKIESLGTKLALLNNKKVQDELREVFAKRAWKGAIENEYFESIERLVLLPINFPRLVQPNSKQQLLDVKDELVSAAPSEFGLFENESPLSVPFMVKTRHLYLMGKGGVGIAANTQTGNALSQAAPVYIDPTNIKNLTPIQQKFIGDAIIKLPHNTISVTTNGVTRSYATLSKATDTKEELISSQVSQYIDGFVDVSNDPFIAQIIQSPSLIPTFMALKKLGVPRRTTEFFMNQPAIREYIKYLEAKGTTWFYNERNVKDFKNKYFPMGNVEESDLMGIRTEPKALLDNIKKYYNKPTSFSINENMEQRNILNEFLKYSVIAQNIFIVTQGTGYDNRGISEPSMRQQIENRTNQAINNTVFSNVEQLFENTSIGDAMMYTGEASSAIDTNLFKTSAINTAPVLEGTRRYLINMNLPKDKYRPIADSVVSSFIDFMIQTNRGLNTRIEELLINNSSSVARRLAKLKEHLKENPESDLAKNEILRKLVPVIKDRPSDAKNIIMTFKSNQAFTSDRYTNAFRELKDNPVIEELYGNLYGDLIRLSFLQTGVGRSGISYNQYIPFEDYAEAIGPMFNNLLSYDNIPNYLASLAYFRNSWQNTDIVPDVATSETDPFPVDYTITPDWYKGLTIQNPRLSKVLYALNTNRKQANYPVVTMSSYFMSQYGEERIRTLVRRLEDANGNPIQFPVVGKDNEFYYIYYPIHPWGNGYQGQEYYNNPNTPSKFENGYFQDFDELLPQELLRAYEQSTVPETKSSQKKPENKASEWEQLINRFENLNDISLISDALNELENMFNSMVFSENQKNSTSYKDFIKVKDENLEYARNWISAHDPSFPGNSIREAKKSMIKIAIGLNKLLKTTNASIVPETVVPPSINNQVNTVPLQEKSGMRSLQTYTNHSGGAIGADSVWEDIGKEFGMVTNKHYYHGAKTPRGNVKLTDEQLNEGWQHVLQANKTLKRKPENYKSLLSRNWYQVKNADAVFAISSLQNDKIVNGGTGWAVQMSIDNNKPTFVFDQKNGQWYSYNFEFGTFMPTETPALTENFAGIGTREINESGKQAIRDVYQKTLTQPQQTQMQLNIGDSTVVTFIINQKPVNVSVVIEGVDINEDTNDIILYNPKNKKRYVITFVDGEYIAAGTITDHIFVDHNIEPYNLKINEEAFAKLIDRTKQISEIEVEKNETKENKNKLGFKKGPCK